MMMPEIEQIGTELTAAMQRPEPPPTLTPATWRRARRMARALDRGDAAGEIVHQFLQVAQPVFEAQQQRLKDDVALMARLQERAQPPG